MQHLIPVQSMLFNVGENELLNVLLDGRDCSEAIQNPVANRVHILRLKNL